mgnify:CR=1 FL=1|jgi:hypothetical protein
MAETVNTVNTGNTAHKASGSGSGAEPAKPASHKRALTISAVLAVLLVLVGWYNDALMFAPFALLILVWQMVCALGYLVLRQWPMLKRCGLRMLIWFAAMAVLVSIHQVYLDSARKKADAVVSALQAYRAREGRYPPNLEALAPRDMAVVPPYAMSLATVRPFRYRLDGDKGENFDLRFFTGFRHQHIYESAAGKWKVTD